MCRLTRRDSTSYPLNVYYYTYSGNKYVFGLIFPMESFFFFLIKFYISLPVIVIYILLD